jgi:GNAT superfamily N-acetyltransferase
MGETAPIEISTDKARLDVDYIHAYLSERSYWAKGRSRDKVARSIEHSLCFGAYDGRRQVGFARLVTDHATFGWLCDVFVDEAYRGRGVGKQLVEAVVAYADQAGLRRLMLATHDAHELYRTYGGFEPLEDPGRWMGRLAAS